MSHRLDIQQRIVARSHDFLRRITTVLPHSDEQARRSTNQLKVPPLPYPSPITATILKAGAPSTFADLASSAYLRDAFTLKHECERHIQRVSRAWFESSDPDGKISTHLTQIYNIFASYYRQTLNEMMDRILSLVHTRLQALTDKKGKRDTFNKQAIPVLEDFYSQNPFPSSNDKRKLAQRTKMSLEQVRVWFQNRRARAKRAGKPPTRLPTSDFVACQPSITSSRLDLEINRLLDDEIERVHSTQVQSKPNHALHRMNLQRSSVLWPLEAPTHAFPSPYRSTHDVDLVPPQGVLLNFDLPWIREARPTRRSFEHPVPDVAGLVNAFFMLTIGDSSGASSCSESDDSDLGRPSIPSIWVPASSSASLISAGSISHTQLPLKRRPFKSRRDPQASISQSTLHRTKPYSRPKPQLSLPRRVPQSQPQLISYHRSSSRSPSSSSFASDDSFSPYASSSDSELGTPPPISTNLPIYLSDKEAPSSYTPHISLPKISKALSQSPVAPRTYTFRTTIVSS